MGEQKLNSILKTPGNPVSSSKVLTFDLSKKNEESDLNSLLANNKTITVVDQLDSWIKEAFLSSFPKYKFDKNYLESSDYKDFCGKHNLDTPDKTKSGIWVFFDWSNKLVHLLPEELHHTVLTARNKNLITESDQKSFYNTFVGVAGLSVGQSAAITVAISGGGQRMKLADYDRLEGTNLNRIRADVSEIGDHKCDIAAKQIYNVNPYASLSLFYEGLNESNLKKFTEGLDVIVDEIDDFQIKAMLRVEAKEKKVPLLMAFDTADGVVLDIERYDNNPDQKPFFGRLTEEEFSNLANSKPDPRLIPSYVIKIMGQETIPDLFKSSILQVGTKLAGVPQLGSTAFLAGSAIAFAIRMIASGNPISGRHYLDLRSLTDLTYDFKLSDEELNMFNGMLK